MADAAARLPPPPRGPPTSNSRSDDIAVSAVAILLGNPNALVMQVQFGTSSDVIPSTSVATAGSAFSPWEGMASFAANYTTAELQIASSSPHNAPPSSSPPAAPFAVSKDPIIILLQSLPDNPWRGMQLFAIRLHAASSFT